MKLAEAGFLHGGRSGRAKRFMNNRTQRRTVLCGQEKIEYELTRKQVKNINIRIKPDGRILVSASSRVSATYIDGLIEEKKLFITRALEKYEKQKEEEPPEEYHFNTGTLEEVCRDVWRLFHRYGIKYPVLKMRDMKSMWGSCRPEQGIVTLNLRLLKVPKSCIEYVVVHEFAHFIYPNHSKEFYALVESLMPDWRERRNVLRKYERTWS